MSIRNVGTRTKNDWLVWILMFLLPRRYWYRNFYLWSKHWRTLRLKKIDQSKDKCENCGKPKYKAVTSRFNQVTLFDVHHLTYERIWKEKLSDLKVLCRECHKKEHE